MVRCPNCYAVDTFNVREAELNVRQYWGDIGWVALALLPLAPVIYLAAWVRWREKKRQLSPDLWQCRRCGRQWTVEM